MHSCPRLVLRKRSEQRRASGEELRRPRSLLLLPARHPCCRVSPFMRCHRVQSQTLRGAAGVLTLCGARIILRLIAWAARAMQQGRQRCGHVNSPYTHHRACGRLTSVLVSKRGQAANGRAQREEEA